MIDPEDIENVIIPEEITYEKAKEIKFKIDQLFQELHMQEEKRLGKNMLDEQEENDNECGLYI